jgi:hypothetical protein
MTRKLATILLLLMFLSLLSALHHAARDGSTPGVGIVADAGLECGAPAARDRRLAHLLQVVGSDE